MRVGSDRRIGTAPLPLLTRGLRGLTGQRIARRLGSYRQASPAMPSELAGRESMSLASTYNQIASWDSRYASVRASQHAARAVAAGVVMGHQDPAEHGKLAVILVRLLDDAADAIYRDREAARTCITRASALLQ